MIREIINYTKYLKEKSSWVFEEGLELKNGLYFVSTFENEKIVLKESFVYRKDKDIVSNSKELAYKISKAWTIDYAKQPYYQKCFDLPQKRIHSISPFLVAFKRTYLKGGKEFEKSQKEKNKNKIKNVDKERVEKYLNKAIKETILDDNDTFLIADKFKHFLSDNFDDLISLSNINEIKDDEYIFFILNIDKLYFESTFSKYLKVRVFNSSKENIISTNGKELKGKDILKHDEILGMSNYFSGYNIDKPFKRHLTSFTYVNQISNKDAEVLFEFKELVSNKVFPNPLPVFIDENEFSDSEEIISIFRQNSKFTYSQVLKQLFKNTPDRTLQNYYLLFFNYKYELEDFDFVSKFRYSLKENDRYPKIRNLFDIKINKDELKRDIEIKNIFFFESEIVKTIFNNSLVRIDEKKNSFSVSYFGEINTKHISKGEPIYQMILKYRKAFYDYIYKSKTQAISSAMWDEIMWNSIIGDLRTDKIKRTKLSTNSSQDVTYHTKSKDIKEKLNIWFSLYNYFINNKKRTDMATKVGQHNKMMNDLIEGRIRAKDFSSEDFAFASGQIIYYILSKSRSEDKSYSRLEPFLQKTNYVKYIEAIFNAFATYKHENYSKKFRIPFSFIMDFDIENKDNKPLKTLLPNMLAGFFSENQLFSDNN